MPFLRMGMEAWYAHSHLGRVLESQLRELRPDGVYALLGNYYLTKVTLQACQNLGLPLYIHVTDDFVTALYQGLPLARRIMAASDFWMHEAVAYASGLASISPVMADEFGQRYGKRWDWFTTLISGDDYDPTPRVADGSIRLVYAGGLGLNRWKSLRQLALGLEALNRCGGPSCSLDVYGSPTQLSQHYHKVHVPGVTNLKGWLPANQLPAVFHSADVLVHVESFDDAMADYTRLSFSTKISQYMMASRCILAVGPRHLGSMQMVLRARAGSVISVTDQTQFHRELERFLGDRAKRDQSAQQGRRWALASVNATEGQRRFRQSLLQAISRSNRRAA